MKPGSNCFDNGELVHGNFQNTGTQGYVQPVGIAVKPGFGSLRAHTRHKCQSYTLHLSAWLCAGRIPYLPCTVARMVRKADPTSGLLCAASSIT